MNVLLLDTHAQPQLDYFASEGWHLHLHGSGSSLVNGWSAGCAAGLALAIGSDLPGRLNTCAILADRSSRKMAFALAAGGLGVGRGSRTLTSRR